MRAFCMQLQNIFPLFRKKKKISRFGRHIHLFFIRFYSTSAFDPPDQNHRSLFFTIYHKTTTNFFLVKIVILKNFLFSNNILYTSIIVEEEPLANFLTKEVFRELRIYDSCILLIYGSCNPKQP